MTKLTDTQAVILGAASQRGGHIALPLPDSLRGGAAAKVSHFAGHLSAPRS